jgi:asparagine synthase (glutamine-hydrolysing)
VDDNNSEFNEAVLARKMATHIGSDHYEIKVTRADLLNNLEKSLWHSEYPSPNLHGVAKFILSKEASKHVKVVLTGEGADELFVGYEWFREDDDFALAMAGTSSTKAHRKSKSLKLNKNAQKVFNALGFLPLIDMKVLLSKGSQFLYTRLFHKRYRLELENNSPVKGIINSVDMDQVIGRESVAKLQYYTIKTMFANYVLTLLGDRQEMSHSIEGRPPFLDHHIFEFAKLIPNEYKLCDGVEKYIFKEMIKTEVLPEIINKRKWPFTAPPISVSPWDCPEMKRLFKKYLSYKSIKTFKIFSYRHVLLIMLLSKIVFKGTKFKHKMNSMITIILSVQIINHLFVINKQNSWKKVL